MAAPTVGEGDGGIEALIVGPDILGVSGEPTHIKTLLASPLSSEFHLSYHRVGGGERRVRPEGFVRRNLARVLSPLGFALRLIKARPRLVHINNSFNFKGLLRDCSLALFAKFTGRRVIFEMHGGEPHEWLRKHPLMRPLVLTALRRVDRVVILSGEQKNFLRKFLPESRCKLIPNMVNPDEFRVSSPGEPPLLLYMGRLLASKGIFDLLEAFARAKPKARLWFAGDGSARRELEAMIEKRGLSDRVRVLGFVVGDEKKRLLASAYALILPSYHEGIPYVILEALASGLPVIATSVGGIPEVVRAGSEGLLVPPGDTTALCRAVARLLENRAERDAMARAARERAWDFSVARVSKQYIELYRSVLAGN